MLFGKNKHLHHINIQNQIWRNHFCKIFLDTLHKFFLCMHLQAIMLQIVHWYKSLI